MMFFHTKLQTALHHSCRPSEKAKMVSHGAAVIVALLALNLAVSCHASLQYGFYKGKCKNQDVETIIRSIVTARWFGDQKIVAGLLRLQFHDCFVRGCDASLLLDGPTSEKTAFPNLTVFGYDLIDQIKAALESACPGVVSCADIIIAATRDAVVLAGGQRYEVQLGRRDGTVSQASLVNLPAPEFSVPTAVQFFAQRGFTARDMVLLLGAHTVGVTHCSIINNRLYNWNRSGRPDPNMDPFYVTILQNVACPIGQMFDNFVFLDDPSSVLKVDNSYYNQLLRNRGILTIDQALALDPTTKPIVQQLASNNGLFLSQFGQALVKMGAFQVLTGTQGQVRKNCRKLN